MKFDSHLYFSTLLNLSLPVLILILTHNKLHNVYEKSSLFILYVWLDSLENGNWDVEFLTSTFLPWAWG